MVKNYCNKHFLGTYLNIVSFELVHSMKICLQTISIPILRSCEKTAKQIPEQNELRRINNITISIIICTCANSLYVAKQYVCSFFLSIILTDYKSVQDAGKCIKPFFRNFIIYYDCCNYCIIFLSLFGIY